MHESCHYNRAIWEIRVDHGPFLNCFGGPDQAVLPAYRTFNFDGDSDVDLADFGGFEAA